ATLDNKTSKICRSYDGKVFDIDDINKPIPPLHPFCRSCLINIPFDNWQPKKRKDNETKEIIDYVDYDKWKSDKGI
ncbi:MAG: minor capsid protein, partial [Bacilli bacterium]